MKPGSADRFRQSFDIMLERQKEQTFREILTDVRDKLKSGVALSDAFASYGDIFPPIYSTSLRAGERSGDLEGVLRRFLKYQKMIVALRKKVISALIYPVILVTLSCAMVFIMLTKVIPKFAEFYAGFDAQLPAFTRLMITISSLLTKNLLVTVIVIVLAIFLIRQWISTTGRLTWIDSNCKFLWSAACCTASRSCSSHSRSARFSAAELPWSRRSRSRPNRSPIV